jgi:hypothetical protein
MDLIRRTLIVVLAAAAVAGCDENERAGAESGDAEIFDQRITFQQVLQRLRDDDAGRMSRAIVQLAPQIDRAKIHGLLLAVWEGDRASYPDLNWAILSEQAAVMNDRCEALVALGTIGRDEDLARLEGIAAGSANAALAGLVASNKPDALQVVDRFSIEPAMPEERRGFAKELLALPRPPQ